MTQWWRDAACLGMEQSHFFPDNESREYAFARKVCSGCPVRFDCLTEAMTLERGKQYNVRFGIWGGLHPIERWRMEQRRRNPQP